MGSDWYQHGSATQQRLLSYLNAHVAIFPRSFGELAAGQDSSSTLIDRPMAFTKKILYGTTQYMR